MIVLPGLLECETWSLTVSEEQAFRKIPEPKRDEDAGQSTP
jgi:hypothetical protein